MLYSQYYISRCFNSNPSCDFIDWINVVEHIVKIKLGYDLLDLPDQPYMISYEKGLNPSQMASIVIKEIF